MMEANFICLVVVVCAIVEDFALAKTTEGVNVKLLQGKRKRGFNKVQFNSQRN